MTCGASELKRNLSPRRNCPPSSSITKKPNTLPLNPKINPSALWCAAARSTTFYHHLFTVALDSPNDDFFTLITNNAVIQVYGRKLQAVADAFGMHGCTTISEFSPELFLPPSDDSQPYIEKIDVLLPTPPKKQGKLAKAEEQEI